MSPKKFGINQQKNKNRISNLKNKLSNEKQKEILEKEIKNY